MLRVVVMVSGGGTNLQAILDAVDNGKITNAEVAAVISNNEGVYAIERAKKHGVPAFVVTPKAYETRDAFDEALLETVKACKPDLIVLAGFLVKIPAAMIEAYRNKIINIHPSLIPSFCGVGYYGLKVHEAALARGVKVTGATVHYVDEDKVSRLYLAPLQTSHGTYTSGKKCISIFIMPSPMRRHWRAASR